MPFEHGYKTGKGYGQDLLVSAATGGFGRAVGAGLKAADDIVEAVVDTTRTANRAADGKGAVADNTTGFVATPSESLRSLGDPMRRVQGAGRGRVCCASW